MKRNAIPGYDPFLFVVDEEGVKESQIEFVSDFTGRHHVLDVACGRGYFLDLLKDAGIGATGVDHDDDAVEEAGKHGHKVANEDIMVYLEENPGKFDGIMLSHIVEHMPGEVSLRLLALASAALKPGGKIVVITPNMRNDDVARNNFWLDFDHIRPVPQMLLARQLTALGMTVVREGSSKIPRQRFKADLKRQPLKTSKDLLRRFALDGIKLNFLLGDTYVVAQKPEKLA